MCVPAYLCFVGCAVSVLLLFPEPIVSFVQILIPFTAIAGPEQGASAGVHWAASRCPLPSLHLALLALLSASAIPTASLSVANGAAVNVIQGVCRE